LPASSTYTVIARFLDRLDARAFLASDAPALYDASACHYHYPRGGVS
jgi:hypothetical protein